MDLKRVLFLAATVSLVSYTAGCGGPSKYEALQINETIQGYELTVPASRLIMTIPKGSLSLRENRIGGATDNPRYFFLEDKASSLIISGWFESEQRFPGIKKLWEDDTKEWSRSGQPEPQAVSFVKVDAWDAIIYDKPISTGTNSHIRGEWLQAGTWIDVHLSITSDRPSADSRAKLMALLKTIQMKAKP